MPSPSWENLDAFLVTDDLGGFATWAICTRRDGSEVSAPFRGIFEDPTVDSQTGFFAIDIADARFLCKTTDAAFAQRFDTLLVGPLVNGVIVGGTTWEVKELPQDDGTGMSYIKVVPPTNGS